IDLAIGMGRYQDFGFEWRTPEKGHHEMLAMPHRDDDGDLRCDVLVEIGWLQHQLAGLAHQSQILGNGNSCRITDPARAKELVQGEHAASATSLDLVLTVASGKRARHSIAAWSYVATAGRDLQSTRCIRSGPTTAKV